MLPTLSQAQIKEALGPEYALLKHFSEYKIFQKLLEMHIEQLRTFTPEPNYEQPLKTVAQNDAKQTVLNFMERLNMQLDNIATEETTQETQES